METVCFYETLISTDESAWQQNPKEQHLQEVLFFLRLGLNINKTSFVFEGLRQKILTLHSPDQIVDMPYFNEQKLDTNVDMPGTL
jgi:hypothetical protein